MVAIPNAVFSGVLRVWEELTTALLTYTMKKPPDQRWLDGSGLSAGARDACAQKAVVLDPVSGAGRLHVQISIAL